MLYQIAYSAILLALACIINGYMCDCELGIPISTIGLYPVYTHSGAMAIELHSRDKTDTKPDHGAACLIKSAITAHLIARASGEINLPNNFLMQATCKHCGDNIDFVAEEF